MNPLSEALKIKTGAETKLQGVGRGVAGALARNKQAVSNHPRNKAFQAQVKKQGGMVID